MRNPALKIEVNRINSLHAKSKAFTDANEIDALSEWAKYLCVLVSGFMENALENIYSDYTKRQLSGPICEFVLSGLRVNNPKSQKFYEISARFKKEWAADLRLYLSENGREEALDTIISNRHLIVHGRAKDSRVTVAQVKTYFDKCIEIVEFIENQCAS